MAHRPVVSWAQKPMARGCRPPRIGRSRSSRSPRMPLPDAAFGARRCQVSQAGDAVMGSEALSARTEEVGQATAAQLTDEAGPDAVPAWEEVDAGRYMPRRIKGSCKGRALG